MSLFIPIVLFILFKGYFFVHKLLTLQLRLSLATTAAATVIVSKITSFQYIFLFEDHYSQLWH